MLIKILVFCACAVGLTLFLFPGLIPLLLRWLGHSVGDAGRASSEIITGEEVKNSPLARYETRAGAVIETKVLAEHVPSNRADLQDEVAAIGAELARHAVRHEIPYRFTVLASPEPNAFAVAGGAVFVTEALLALCGSDRDCIAGVLGHEIIHIDQRHALRNLAASAAVRGGVRLLSFGRGAVLSRVVSTMQDLLVQGYRQDQEFEADLFGCRLARLAGFHPDGLTRLLLRLEAQNPDGQGPLAEALAYFKSHPPVRVRVERLRRELKQ